MFTGIIISGPNVATIDNKGIMTMRTTRMDGVVLKVSFNLADRKRLQEYLQSSNTPYVVGETEKDMMEKLILIHFIQPEHGFSWVLEKSELL